MRTEAEKRGWSAVAERRKQLFTNLLLPSWNALLDATGASAGQRLLDAGCGSGELVGLALARGCVVTGVDLAPAMIELCRAAAHLQPARFIEASIDDLPFEDREFDVVTAAMSIHFCDDVVKAQRELLRVLRPGGRVGITAPSAQSLQVLQVFLVAKELLPASLAEQVMRPTMFASPGILAQSLLATGFRDIDETIVDTPLVGSSFDDVWNMQKTWAPIRMAVDLVGEETFVAAYQERLQETIGRSAPHRLDMKYRVVTGTKP